jgi:hypothetical protein
MRVTLQAADQFGPDGPQPGDQFDVFSFVYDADGDLWFQAFLVGRSAEGFFTFSPHMVRTDYQ